MQTLKQDHCTPIMLFSIYINYITSFNSYILECVNHFLFRADLYEDDAIQEILRYEPIWVDEYRQLKNGENPDKIGEFSNCKMSMLFLVFKKATDKR
jgi:hypothetical protein